MDSSDFSLDLTAEIEELRDAFAGMAPPPLGGDGFSPVGPLSVIGVEEVANWRRKFRLPDDVTIRIPGPFDKVSDFELGEILGVRKKIYGIFVNNTMLHIKNTTRSRRKCWHKVEKF
ncbi:hypothetical protein YC2023_058895 [Brassica napus]